MYNVSITTYTYEVSGYNDRLNRKTEDSLENTFSCVPKVQGSFLPNLSGKRTEMRVLRSLFVCPGSPYIGLLFCLVIYKESW